MYVDHGDSPPGALLRPFEIKDTPWISWDKATGHPERFAPTQNGAWVLEPYYKYATPVAINPAKEKMVSENGVPFKPDDKFKEVYSRLRAKFPFPVWLHALIPPLGMVDSGRVPRNMVTNAVLIVDIMTTKALTYAQRKHTLNTRLPVLGINSQPLMGHAYTTPTVPETHGMELSYCLESIRDSSELTDSLYWTKMYAGLVAKKLSSPYDIYPNPASASAARHSLFWHYHPFSNA